VARVVGSYLMLLGIVALRVLLLAALVERAVLLLVSVLLLGLVWRAAGLVELEATLEELALLARLRQQAFDEALQEYAVELQQLRLCRPVGGLQQVCRCFL
jgi:hypothetical protein